MDRERSDAGARHGEAGRIVTSVRDNPPMECAAARDLLSARLDGESLADADAGALAEHVRGCTDCRRFEGTITTLQPARLRVAAPADTVAGRVLAAIEPDRSTAPETRFVRVALFTVALGQAAVAVAQLLAGGGGLSAHQQRHLGVFSLALAVGFAYTALRPRRVGALLPLAGALAFGLVVTGIIDVAAGRTPIAGESAHLLDVAGLTLLWILVQLERPRPMRDEPRSPADDTPATITPIRDRREQPGG